jgi:hypothetical protein
MKSLEPERNRCGSAFFTAPEVWGEPMEVKQDIAADIDVLDFIRLALLSIRWMSWRDDDLTPYEKRAILSSWASTLVPSGMYPSCDNFRALLWSNSTTSWMH